MLPMPLKIAVLVETTKQRDVLRNLVFSSGHKATHALLVDDLLAQMDTLASSNIDVWLIKVDPDCDRYDEVEDWLLNLDMPVIVDDLDDDSASEEDRQLWRRRVNDKLHQLQGSINLAREQHTVAKFVWVLGASTGGPEAIKEFFGYIPANLNVGFIYVQHIDPGYENTLADIVNKYSHYPAYPVIHGDVLRENGTAIIANDNCVDIQENGTLSTSPGPWPGDYSPSIDRVFANVARCYGNRCGVIVFTGMAEDGAAGIRLVHQQGGQVWVQSPSSCIVSSMPDSALHTGIVSVIASPEGLAAKLTDFMLNEVGSYCE
jgi:chemosensory pili system protein ChpB (putative protein-glutamate methylesterase)